MMVNSSIMFVKLAKEIPTTTNF